MGMSNRRLDVVRGTRAALILGGVGALAPVALMVGVTVIQWWINHTSEWDRRYDLLWLRNRMVGPTLGCAVIFAAAGWATYAPVGRHRFTPALVLIVAGSLVLWPMLMSLSLTPQRLKGVDHPEFYPLELTIWLTPPILIALGLAQGRASGRIPRKPMIPDDDLG